MELCSLRYFFILAICLPTLAHAHGGGATEPNKEKPPPEVHVEYRRVPPSEKSLHDSDLLKLVSQTESPPDVALVHCNLNQFAVCRGLELGLYDSKGKQVAKSSSGTQGVVGFEGLKTGRGYEVRILSDRYRGKLEITSGRTWYLNAERISE